MLVLALLHRQADVSVASCQEVAAPVEGDRAVGDAVADAVPVAQNVLFAARLTSAQPLVADVFFLHLLEVLDVQRLDTEDSSTEVI